MALLPAGSAPAGHISAGPAPALKESSGTQAAGFTAAAANSRLMDPLVYSWRAVELLGALMLAAMLPILIRDGVVPFLTILLSLTCLTLVKMFVKMAMTNGLSFPYTITASHMALTCVAAFAMDTALRRAEGRLPPATEGLLVSSPPGMSERRGRQASEESWRALLREGISVLPISIVNGASLCLNNTALVFGGVGFVTILSCGTPAATWGIEVLRLRTKIHWQTVLGVAVVCLGGMCCAKGALDFSLAACLLALGANFCRGFKTVWQHDLLCVDLPPCRLTAWSSFFTFLGILPLAIAFEGFEGLRQFAVASAPARNAWVCSAITAMALNVVQCFALKQQGPVMSTVVGNLQLIMVIVLASAWLHESVTMAEWFGTALLVLGTILTKAATPSQPAKKTDA